MDEQRIQASLKKLLAVFIVICLLLGQTDGKRKYRKKTNSVRLCADDLFNRQTLIGHPRTHRKPARSRKASGPPGPLKAGSKP